MTTPNPDFINFGGLLIPERDSQAHFAFTGTTGSGKTLLMRLLQQSTLCHVGQGLGYRAIVYDAKQDAMQLLAAYCDRSRLFTLNPFDDRGVAWDIAADVTEPRVALEMAFTLIPEASESQPYFANASRHLTYGVMLSFMLRGLDWTLADVLRALSSAKLCRKVLEQHRHTAGIVEHYFSDERLLNDIFSTIATKMLLYESIAGCWDAANERISLKTWSTEEMTLILGNTEISRFAIDNINRCIFKRASDLILSKSEGTTDRSWFFIDEVSEAGRLPISSLLKKGRSKGGRVAIAYQSISGLRDPKLFGQHQTDHLGQQTAQPSLVLGCEQPITGYHETNFSMAYSSHISWQNATSPVPMEVYPSLAFDSLFDNRGSRRNKSVLDRVQEHASSLSRQVSAADREHMKLMCDVVALAFQTDKTRFATLLLCRDISGLFYPFSDVRKAHHSASHDDQSDDFERISRYYVSQMA